MNGDLFRATTRKYMELRHIRTLEQLRSHTTVSNKTFLKFWHNPDLMPLGIWEQIMDSLNVTTEDRLEIFK
jgi:phage-related protein